MQQTASPPGLADAARARATTHRRRLAAVDVLITVTWVSVALAIAMYLATGALLRVSDAASAVTAGGVLAGVVATDLVLVMLVLAARVPLIDRAVGQDRAMALHRSLGKPALYLLLAHGALLTLGYAMADGLTPLSETLQLFATPDMPLAYLAILLFVTVVVTSLVAVRRRFRYEVWHGIHLLSYAAVLVALPHQLSVGSVFVPDSVQRGYWLALYGIAFGSIIVFRLARPVVASLRHRLRVESVETIAPGVVSVHLSGRALDRLRVDGGQFGIWRFWGGGTWWRAHPVSFSSVPTATSARITVRALGRGTGRFERLAPGTVVSLEGPYGLFTDRARSAPSLAIAAAGIGVTPARSLLEHSAFHPGEVTVLLRASSPEERYLWSEVRELVDGSGGLLIEDVGSRGSGTASWLSADAVARGTTISSVFPTLADADLYVCGPDAWTRAVERDALAAGVPADRIRIERFES